MKDKFAALDDDFKSAACSMNDTEIAAKLAEINVSQEKLMESKEIDADLHSLQEQVREAGAIYREGTKSNRLRTQFLMQVLRSRGKDV